MTVCILFINFDKNFVSLKLKVQQEMKYEIVGKIIKMCKTFWGKEYCKD